MKTRPIFKLVGASAALVAIAVLSMSFKTPRVQAGQQSDEDSEQSKIRIGYAIAPVTLNLNGKNRALVGLGSYIVNAQSDCNGCHSQGPMTEYLPQGNPYTLSPPFSGTQQINPSFYLGGGRDFGPAEGLQHIYSRNLTPDKTGRPEGGHTFEEFLTILRTGKDYDHIRSSCTGAPDGVCLPFPFNPDLLQIMPWPIDKNMSDHDIRAIYEYLSAIPCIDTNIPGAPAILRNDCPKD
jgi:hypothetical protein